MADTDKIEELPVEEQAPQSEAGENEEVPRTQSKPTGWSARVLIPV
jgi:hypothetical protein